MFCVVYQIQRRKSDQISLLEESDCEEYHEFSNKTQKSRITFLLTNKTRIKTESGAEMSASKYQR